MREVFPEDMVKVMEEQLNSPCTEEMASFDRFIDFMDEDVYDVVIFDTAPTGHTIRLLELPVDWSRHIKESEEGTGQTCMGPVQVLQDSRAKYDRAISYLQNPKRTTFAFVVQPEGTPLRETERATKELRKIGVESNLLIVNGILPAEVCDTSYFAKRKELQEEYLSQIEERIKAPTKKMYLLSEEVKGNDLLRVIGKRLWDGTEQTETFNFQEEETINEAGKIFSNPDVSSLIEPKGQLSRSIFFAGKGGVGKTSISCVTALWTAKKGYKTLLITTDPAAHLAEVLEQPVGNSVSKIKGVDNLWSVKIDPKQVADAYREKIIDDTKSKYSPEVVEVMREQLDSPCTEEMATFDKFLDYMISEDYQIVVFDTAPTGHTLRLLELPIDWSKQMELKASISSEGELINEKTQARFNKVIDRMKDPDQTTMCFVVYPENTPIMEAYRAVEELKTVDIHTNLIVANMVLPKEQIHNPYFAKRFNMQQQHLAEMENKFSGEILRTPLLDKEVKGLKTLAEVGQLLFGEV